MKQDACNIPLALQHQMLIQAALSVLALVLAALAMLFFSITVSVPFLLCAVLLAFSAFRLYNIGRRGQYLVLEGTVLKLERTPLRLRPKAMLMEVEGKALLVVLRNRHISVREGDALTLYIADTAPLYEWRGIHRLHSYLAVVPARGSGTGIAPPIQKHSLSGSWRHWTGNCRSICRYTTMGVLTENTTI